MGSSPSLVYVVAEISSISNHIWSLGAIRLVFVFNFESVEDRDSSTLGLSPRPALWCIRIPHALSCLITTGRLGRVLASVAD